MTETEFRMIWGLITALARSAQLIEVDKVQKLLDTIGMSHTLGPILDPTTYRDVGIDNLEEQQVLAEGFMAFRRAIEKVRESGLKRN